jgi:predicted DNA-binding protein YlxM (UPF0122 family)
LSFSGDDLLLEQRVRFGELYDIYSSLLTEKQRVACEFLLKGDLSIAELGEELGTTRQGAHDLVRRARDFLEGLERDLGLLGLRSRCEELREFARARGDCLPEELLVMTEALLPDNSEGGTADV